MIRDITLGQFVPGNSIIHKIDPRAKIIFIIAYIVFLFVANNFISLAFISIFIFIIIALSQISIKLYLKSLKMIFIIILITSILNLFYGTGEPIFEWGFLKITMQGIQNSIFISIRIISLILISSVLTFTTSPTNLTDALEYLMKPLNKIKVPVHDIAMMITIALRFVPTLLEETSIIINAQKARGSDLESGTLKNKIKSLIPILIPLFVSSFRHAYDLAIAMECRCYRGGKGRTRMRALHIGKLDIIAGFLMIFAMVGVIFCNIIF